LRLAVIANSGPGVGLGHLRRCLTLARAGAERGADPTFFLGNDPVGAETVGHQGFEARPAAGGLIEALSAVRPQVIVADSYQLDGEDFRRLRRVAPLAVLDDLADRDLPADLVWNGGIQAEGLDYSARTPPDARLLLGPSFALLAPEYRGFGGRTIRDAVEVVLITAGGTDPAGALAILHRAVRRGLPEAVVDLVLGPYVASAPEAAREDRLVRVHRALPSLFSLLERADLVVAAGGQTTYELAATGAPAVVIWSAENQRPQSEAFERLGTLHCAGDVREPAAEERVRTAVAALAADPARRRRMSSTGLRCLDGEGAARTAAAVLELGA
jgi:UDP-2,4-diacetamido-2,4,6-trideoxy-beta-L-altropyranose hydrolase